MDVIYFMSEGEFVKIGVCKYRRLPERLKEINHSSPNEVGIIGVFVPDVRNNAFEIEKYIHNSLSEYRSHGEWFRLSGECLKLTNKVCFFSKNISHEIFESDFPLWLHTTINASFVSNPGESNLDFLIENGKDKIQAS